MWGNTKKISIEGKTNHGYSLFRYWHRSLNPKKLIEVKFSHLSRNMTMQRHLKLFRLPETVNTEGLRKLKITDVPEACKLLNKVIILIFFYQYM